MAKPPLVTGVDMNAASWQRCWKKLSPDIQREAHRFLGELLMCNPFPAKLHCHKLQGYDDIYTMHICTQSNYKASFKLVGQIAYFRRAAPHDVVDDNP